MKCSGGIFLLRSVVLVTCVLFSFTAIRAQGVQVTEEKEGYAQTIAKRVEKIVAGLQSTDSVFNSKVKNLIIDQYYNLGITHDARNSQIRAIKDQNRDLNEDDKDHIRRIEANTQQQLEQLHKQFLVRLAELCTPQQIEQIKDGMTYGVVQVTYKAYQDMLPDLTSEQKKQILAWLIEARELAMDAESSEKKHAVFGKYKGRINNYLSAAGIDMKKAEADWQKRIKEKNATNKD
jgi:hypothetical protein